MVEGRSGINRAEDCVGEKLSKTEAHGVSQGVKDVTLVTRPSATSHSPCRNLVIVTGRYRSKLKRGKRWLSDGRTKTTKMTRINRSSAPQYGVDFLKSA